MTHHKKDTYADSMMEALRNPRITLVKTPFTSKSQQISALDKEQLKPVQEQAPIVQYNTVLKTFRNASKNIHTYGEEIGFAVDFNAALKYLGQQLGLDDTHFHIDTTGDIITVVEEKGEHVIAPTHFENGAYFSHPHADHQLRIEATAIPKIRIGKYTRIGRNTSAHVGGDLRIGDGVWLSPGSCLLRQDHDAYGSPSLCSRTVSMTRLPSIRIEDYAWVGREAMVGYGADYIGKASIIATRCFLNTWVSDYSITGENGKIIRYLPYKAALMETCKPTVEDILRCTDWESVEKNWHHHFKTTGGYDAYSHTLQNVLKDKILQRKNPTTTLLDINFGFDSPSIWAAQQGYKVDLVSHDRTLFPFMLQLAQDTQTRRVRLRQWDRMDALSFVDTASARFGKSLGYTVVMYTTMPTDVPDHTIALLQEMHRILKDNGFVVLGCDRLSDDGDLIKMAEYIGFIFDARIEDSATNKIYITLTKG